MATDLESVYSSQPSDSDDSWRHDYSREDPLDTEREWDALMQWERRMWPERREEER